LQKDSPTKFCNGAQMANFWRFFASCISSEPHAASFRPASYFHTKATPCVADIQSAMAEIRQGKKLERKRKKEEATGRKYNGRSYYTGRP